MGQILSQPVTEKHSEEGQDKYLAFGLSSMQGWRINMEDAHTTILDMLKEVTSDDDEDEDEDDDDGNKAQDADSAAAKKLSSEELVSDNDKTSSFLPNDHTAFFGVFDGHGGEKAAIFAGKHLHRIIKDTKEYKQNNYTQALKQGFLDCDQAILKDILMRDDESGCAATSAIITPQSIICGNAGDSRTIMSINGYAKALSYDHKPSNEGEKTRISAAGGYVDMGRVNGNLALSRGIGDFEFKKNADLPAEEQIVTCYPDVIVHNIDYEQDEFVILACDGIWDCLTSQKCVECVRRGIYERWSLTEICEEIMDLCCAPTSDGTGIGCDNMSIVIVALLDYAKNETLEQWYDKIIKKIEISENEKATSASEQPKFGPISEPYEKIYKEMYGNQYDIGVAGDLNSNGGGRGSLGLNGSIFGRGGYDDEDGTGEDHNGNVAGGAYDDDPGMNGDAVSLSKLLSSNALTNENGVIYLDTSSAQNILANLGVVGLYHHEDAEQEKIEEVQGDSNDESDHENGKANEKGSEDAKVV